MAMVKNVATYTLLPRGVRLAGAALTLVGLALPWLWLRTYQPAKPPITRLGPLRPELRGLPTGTFLMGSPESEEGRFSNEKQHEVEIRTRFAISVTEVTQGQYEQVMGQNPSQFPGDPDRPVENVGWLDAVEYCNRLSQKEGRPLCYRIEGQSVSWLDGLRCTGYRLPTEAEWEYAARADGKTRYAGSETLDEVGWWQGNSGSATHPVSGKRANAWGLYDFTGNVWEWVWDRYGAAYEKLSRVDPMGPESGSSRVSRGGAWGYSVQGARVAYRFGRDSGDRFGNQGFRLARSYPQEMPVGATAE